MRRRFVLTKAFEAALEEYPKHDILLEDIEDKILENQDVGDLIPGTGGASKVSFG